MTETDKYEGWSNYPTWCINLWLSNDESLSEETDTLVRDAGNKYDAAKAIESFVDELNELVGAPTEGFTADLYGWALDNVNWFEIADGWIGSLAITIDNDGDYVIDDEDGDES